MLKYSIKQLEIFNAVAEHSSVSSAARKLSMTQSAVSMSLSQLEKLLDRPLFIRQGNRLLLSHWGRWLRPKARKLVQDARQIELGVHDQQVISGVIKLSSSQTAGEHLIPDLIRHLSEDFPELRIELVIENTEHVTEGILNYDYDLGVIESRNDDSRIHHEPWLDDHLVIVASPYHPFAQKDVVSLAQLEQEKWVLREHGAGTRGIFDGAIHGLVDNLHVWREYQHVPVLKAIIKQGSCLSALPLLDVEKEVKEGSLVILNTPQLNMDRTLSFIWLTSAGENPLRDCILSEGHRQVRARK